MIDDLDDGIKCPKEVTQYLKEKNVSKELSKMIIGWFTDFNNFEFDFETVYNCDYISVNFAQLIASMYLNDEPVKLKLLRVTIDEFLDILPNDLREQCIEKKKISTEHYPPVLGRNDFSSPTVFLSYSWDSEKYKVWIRNFSNQLKEYGINVILDQNDLILGDPFPIFMEQSIKNSDYVLIMCTPKYKEKADSRRCGVGYEESIITSDVLLNQNHRKYITVLVSGTWESSTPIWANGKYGADLTSKNTYKDEFEKIVSAIKGN